MTLWTQLSETDYRHGFIDVNGLRTRYVEAGTGEPVIMLHGTSGHLEAFVRNIADLAQSYNCHAIDMMGHGYTEGPDLDYRIPRYVEHVLGYLDAKGISRAHFIGESLGGWVSGRLAADHPDRVRSLVLVAPGGTVANPRVMEKIRDSTRAAVGSGKRELTKSRLELLMYDPADVSDELVDVRHAIYNRPQFVERIERLLCLQSMENRTQDLLSREQMARITAPTRIVWGAENPFGDVPEAQQMHASIAGSELEIYGQCGHWPQHEHAERFNRETRHFFDKVGSRA